MTDISTRGTALVRAPGARLAEGIVTHQERQPVDVELAGRQHAEYVRILAASGWAPSLVPVADEFPDAVFVEDMVVVIDDLAVLTRPGAPARRAEQADVETAAIALGLRVERLDGTGTLDGGDVLQVGRTVYVGRGGRTDDEGIAAFRRLLEPMGRTVVPVRLSGVLHLKSAMTALPDGSLLGMPAHVDTVGAGLPPLHVPMEEAGAHVVPLGGNTVLIAASAPKTAQWLHDDLGFDVVTVDISEFEKLEGCVTCLSVLTEVSP